MKIYGAPYETVTVECRSAKIMVVWIVAASAEACITLLHIALLCSPVFLLLHSGPALECRQNARVIIQEQIPALPDINITAVHLWTHRTPGEQATNIRKKRWTDLHPHTFTLFMALKGVVHTKMRIVSSFTHTHAIPHSYAFFFMWKL